MIMSECSEFSECQPTSDTVQQASKQQPPTHPFTYSLHLYACTGAWCTLLGRPTTPNRCPASEQMGTYTCIVRSVSGLLALVAVENVDARENKVVARVALLNRQRAAAQ